MGIRKDLPVDYYDTDGNHGNYRYIPLSEIIDSFTATYVGEGKLCEGVVLNDVNFHAIRGLQELSYDTFKSTKDWEVKIPSTLVLVMPNDYVNYVKLSWSDSNGIERIIYPTSKTSNPLNVSPHTGVPDGFLETRDWGGWDLSGEPSVLQHLRENEDSDTNANYKSNTTSDIGSVDADNVNDQYGNLLGSRYGIDPQHAQANGSFFTEEAIYKHILYGVLLARKDTNQGLLGQLKKERAAETRKAKLRLSNIKLEELTQVLRGNSKIIKH